MELYQLQYFIEAARNRNFTRAARRLNLATPALSLQIQKLEKELGTRLFNRGQKETLLTPAGEILFEKAQGLLNMADSVKQSVAEVSDLRAGRLSTAFIPPLGTYWLPDIFREFRNSYPCLNLLTHEETSLGVAALVEDATAELGFLELPTNNQLFEVKEIWNEPVYAALPADHPLAGKKSISLKQLEKDSFVVKRGESQEQTIEACRAAGFEPRIGCECSEQETKIAMVQAGLGVLLLPQLAASMLREGVVAVPIHEPKLLREVGLIHRRGKELSAAAKAFVEFIKKKPFSVTPENRPHPPQAQVILPSAPMAAAEHMDHSAPEGLLTPQKFLERSAYVFPDKVAVRFNEQTYTYAELSRRVNRLAWALRKAGLETGDRVAFICSNIPPMLEAHYGVPLAGGVLVPVNVRLTSGEIAYILNHSGAKFLFADVEFASAVRPILGKLEGIKHVIDIFDTRPARPLGEIGYEDFLAAASPKPVPLLLRDEEELISINYTSGTTGKPKGVTTVHRGAYLNAVGQVVGGALTPASKYLWTLPMFHCNGWCYAWAVTMVGGTHIMLRKFDPAKVWRLIQTEGITHMSGSPALCAALLNHWDRPKTPLLQPLIIGIGGGQPSPGLLESLEALGIRAIHGYGLTETYGAYTVCEPQNQWLDLGPKERFRLLARQGVPAVMGDAVRVVDENMRDVRRDGQTVGEVVMRGAIITKGYYKEPEATAKEFRGGWFHSGDLAVVHPDGYFELRDRLLDFIAVGGDKVSSTEVEQALARHPDVAEAAVVGVPHQELGETPKAFVVLKQGATLKPRQLLSYCREHLAAFKCPTAIEFIKALPRTSTGKVQKYVLREREWVGEEKRIHGV